MVEIPRGSRNKYEIDDKTGAIWLDRMLFTATRYPTDYGYTPETLAEDGDPLDALVLVEDPTFPGCHIKGRVLGVFWMEDEAGPDAKILTVPAKDARWEGLDGIDDLPEFLLKEIEHFFDIYKTLEPGKTTTTGGWEGPARAADVIEDARRRHTG